MKHLWLAHAIVGLLAAGSGVAIGGVLAESDAGGTEAPVASTDAVGGTDPTLSASSVTTVSAPTTDDATTTVETTAAPTTDATTTTVETTAAPTTDAEPAAPPAREELTVASANGADIDGSAARMIVRLEEIGYNNVVPLDGIDVVDFSVVYYADSFQTSAVRMAQDLELHPDFIAALADAPDLADLPADVELLVYVGVDRSG